MQEKFKHLENRGEELLKKAIRLRDKGVKFWIQRNRINTATGEKLPDKLEYGWKIMNMGDNGLVLMYSEKNETFYISIEKLQELNSEIFSSIE